MYLLLFKEKFFKKEKNTETKKLRNDGYFIFRHTTPGSKLQINNEGFNGDFDYILMECGTFSNKLFYYFKVLNSQ